MIATRFACCCVLFFALASPARAELDISPRSIDLGEIRGSSPRQQRFELSNTGDASIEILEVQRGCGCLAVQCERHLLKPGEKTALVVQLRTTGQPNGPRSWNLQVRFRDGDVVREQNLVLAATIRNEVVVEPSLLALYVNKALTQEVIVTDTRTPTLKVTQVQTTAPAMKTTTERLSEGRTKITFAVAAKDLVAQRQEGFLNIYTDDPLYSPLQVPYTLTRGDLPTLLVTPARVQIPPGRGTHSALVRVRPAGEQSVAIEKIESDDPAITCTWAAGPENGATLRIQVDGRNLAPGTHAVRVHLAQPTGEIVTIPVITSVD